MVFHQFNERQTYREKHKITYALVHYIINEQILVNFILYVKTSIYQRNISAALLLFLTGWNEEQLTLVWYIDINSLAVLMQWKNSEYQLQHLRKYDNISIYIY